MNKRQREEQVHRTRERRYVQAENLSRCTQALFSRETPFDDEFWYQCLRRRGHGPAGDLCRQHAASRGTAGNPRARRAEPGEVEMNRRRFMTMLAWLPIVGRVKPEAVTLTDEGVPVPNGDS